MGEWNEFGVCVFFFLLFLFFYVLRHLLSLSIKYEQTQAKLKRRHMTAEERVHTNRKKKKKQCRNKQENKLILAIIPFQWKLCKLISELEMKNQFFFVSLPKSRYMAGSITSHRTGAHSHLLHFYILRILDIAKLTRNEEKNRTWCGNIAKRTETMMMTAMATKTTARCVRKNKWRKKLIEWLRQLWQP